MAPCTICLHNKPSLLLHNRSQEIRFGPCSHGERKQIGASAWGLQSLPRLHAPFPHAGAGPLSRFGERRDVEPPMAAVGSPARPLVENRAESQGVFNVNAVVASNMSSFLQGRRLLLNRESDSRPRSQRLAEPPRSLPAASVPFPPIGFSEKARHQCSGKALAHRPPGHRSHQCPEPALHHGSLGAEATAHGIAPSS